jgi:hypothetical protein
MASLTHIPLARLAPGLCVALAALGVLVLPQSIALGLSIVLFAGTLARVRGPNPAASSRVGTRAWTVRYGGQVITMPLDRIAEVRIDHPLNGPDRVYVLMTTGLCLPLPDAALPDTAALVDALRARNVPLRLQPQTVAETSTAQRATTALQGQTRQLVMRLLRHARFPGRL